MNVRGLLEVPFGGFEFVAKSSIVEGEARGRRSRCVARLGFPRKTGSAQALADSRRKRPQRDGDMTRTLHLRDGRPDLESTRHPGMTPETIAPSFRRATVDGKVEHQQVNPYCPSMSRSTRPPPHSEASWGENSLMCGVSKPPFQAHSALARARAARVVGTVSARSRRLSFTPTAHAGRRPDR